MLHTEDFIVPLQVAAQLVKQLGFAIVLTEFERDESGLLLVQLN